MDLSTFLELIEYLPRMKIYYHHLKLYYLLSHLFIKNYLRPLLYDQPTN